MARISYIAAFVFILLLAGCSKNADAGKQVSDSLYWTPPDGPLALPWTVDPLLLQLSVDPVVYISHIPEWQKLTEDEENDGILVMPSTLDDILPRITVFQGERDAPGEEAAVLISGDDRALCGSVLKAIGYAKKAKIKYILFEHLVRNSHMAFKLTGFLGNSFLKYFEFPNGFKPPPELAKNITTITISKDGAFQWGDTPVTTEDIINEFRKLRIRDGHDEILLVVRVDADTPFPFLRYVLSQAKWSGISRVMIARR